MTKFTEGQHFRNSWGAEIKVHSFKDGYVLCSYRETPSCLWELCRVSQRHLEVLLSAEKMEEER